MTDFEQALKYVKSIREPGLLAQLCDTLAVAIELTADDKDTPQPVEAIIEDSLWQELYNVSADLRQADELACQIEAARQRIHDDEI